MYTDDFTKPTANDRASGYYDIVLMPWPVSPLLPRCLASKRTNDSVGQFVLFAFFILSTSAPNGVGSRLTVADKAKGNAIATGHLFFFTLIAKLMWVAFMLVPLYG
jgi:hypothetical protein